MTCLWRCPALIRTCFRWSLMYTVIFVFFKINSRNIRVILISFRCSMQVGGRVQSRWDLIYTALRGGFKSSLDIRVRILIQCIPIKTEKILEIQWFFCLYIYSWSLIYTVIKFCVTPCYSRNGHTGAKFTTKKPWFTSLCFRSIFNSPLQEAILTYNTAHAKKWDFTALNLLCTEVSCGQRYDRMPAGFVQNINQRDNNTSLINISTNNSWVPFVL